MPKEGDDAVDAGNLQLQVFSASRDGGALRREEWHGTTSPAAAAQEGRIERIEMDEKNWVEEKGARAEEGRGGEEGRIEP